MARGHLGKPIFLGDEDRSVFLQTFSDACAMTGWRVHAWALTSGHYHFFIETPEANLVHGMSWLQNTVTRRHNIRHGTSGRLFSDRYKSVPVEASDPARYQALCDFIHLSPVRAKMIRPTRGESVGDFPWSSVAEGYLLPSSKRSKWMVAGEGLSRMGFPDSTAGRRRLVEALDQRAAAENSKRCGIPAIEEGVDGRCSSLERGWYWGGPDFLKKLERLKESAKPGKATGGRAKPKTRSHSQAQAEKWLREGLESAGLKKQDLAKLQGSAPIKLALAELLWRQTSVSQGWIAEKLEMCSAANVSQRLRVLEIAEVEKQLSKPTRDFLKAARRDR